MVPKRVLSEIDQRRVKMNSDIGIEPKLKAQLVKNNLKQWVTPNHSVGIIQNAVATEPVVVEVNQVDRQNCYPWSMKLLTSVKRIKRKRKQIQTPLVNQLLFSLKALLYPP